MFRFAIVLLAFSINQYSTAQVTYTLAYKDSSTSVIKIVIEFRTHLSSPVSFIMPRSVPGGHDFFIYDRFISNVYSTDNEGNRTTMLKDANGAPRWYLSDPVKKIRRIEYDVDLEYMEKRLAAGDASIIRPGFAGILNYSVLGWIEGTEQEKVECNIETFPQWNIFSTLQPSSAPSKGIMKFNAENYFTLADAQTYIGTRFFVKEYKGIVPLFIVSYCQTEDEYLDDYGRQGIMSMGILKDYFGELPYRHYTILLRKAIPFENISAPALAMEHLQSSTFFGDTSLIRKAPMRHDELINSMGTYLHHMAHAFIPLRCYGDTYRPYVMEIPPIINNVWFNEGFLWFLVYDTLKIERLKTVFYNSTYHSPAIIKKMTLEQLSQAASTMYGGDFRIGRAVYSRGASMAMEMDDYLKAESGGKKSMKDVFRYLYQWAKKEQRPFTMEEFPLLINKASGIDMGEIYSKWQLPVE